MKRISFCYLDLRHRAMNPILLVVMMGLSCWNHEPFPEVLLCCVISRCHKIRLYLMNCSSQWDCCFVSVCRPSVEHRILGEWYGWKCRSVLSQCLCDYRCPVLPHTGAWFVLFSSNRVHCTVYSPCCLAH